jgi:hypothetical protein
VKNSTHKIQKDLELMIEISENAPADDLLESVGGDLAPLTINRKSE